MKSRSKLNFKTTVCTAFIACIMCLMSQPAGAYYYNGGDWGGRDLSLLDGDTLMGSFDNIGLFSIPAGATISGIGGNLSLKAERIVIDGALNGDTLQGYDFFAVSNNDIILNGAISAWRSINLTAGTISFNSGSSISTIGGTTSWTPATGTSASGGLIISASGNSNDGPALEFGDLRISPIPGGALLVAGGSISLVATPVPTAAWLLSSGLMGLLGIRRKMQD